ncbi:hypothetical protein Nocox_42475 [Nonomuraea coxensis DSM 45129]|uniref:Uncharacterized protein n=1 Tax=Nonomuraea coxensis DSM 45129 TaxID=1122611 RepID=A0ABX8UIZ6_9ACTN|nr:hypothetical protein Nocox_42475 [Nonomuraea coxensis DSM 45129]
MRARPSASSPHTTRRICSNTPTNSPNPARQPTDAKPSLQDGQSLGGQAAPNSRPPSQKNAQWPATTRIAPGPLIDSVAPSFHRSRCHAVPCRAVSCPCRAVSPPPSPPPPPPPPPPPSPPPSPSPSPSPSSKRAVHRWHVARGGPAWRVGARSAVVSRAVLSGAVPVVLVATVPVAADHSPPIGRRIHSATPAFTTTPPRPVHDEGGHSARPARIAVRGRHPRRNVRRWPLRPHAVHGTGGRAASQATVARKAISRAASM